LRLKGSGFMGYLLDDKRLALIAAQAAEVCGAIRPLPGRQRHQVSTEHIWYRRFRRRKSVSWVFAVEQSGGSCGAATRDGSGFGAMTAGMDQIPLLGPSCGIDRQTTGKQRGAYPILRIILYLVFCSAGGAAA